MLDTEEEEGELYKALFAHFKFSRFKENRHEWYQEWAGFELKRRKLILIDLFKFKKADYEAWWNNLDRLLLASRRAMVAGLGSLREVLAEIHHDRTRIKPHTLLTPFRGPMVPGPEDQRR